MQNEVEGHETPTNDPTPLGRVVTHPGLRLNGAVDERTAPLLSTATQRLSDGHDRPVMSLWPIWKTHHELGSAGVADSPTSPDEVPMMHFPSEVQAVECIEGTQVTAEIDHVAMPGFTVSSTLPK
jgi:hypothetical protein